MTQSKSTKLYSIKSAGREGVERLRKPIWANPLDHVKISIFEGEHGPWIKLYAPANVICGQSDPVDILFTQFDLDEPVYERYDGPLPDSEEYQKEVAELVRRLG